MINFKLYCTRKKCNYLIKRPFRLNGKVRRFNYCIFCNKYCDDIINKYDCANLNGVKFYL